MYHPELYHGANNLQKNAGLQCLKEHAERIKWNVGNTAIDLGCGDGSFTAILRKHYMPSHCEKLVACDISDKMVKYAIERYGDETITFRVWDIQSQPPEGFIGAFDHVFSFFALHWVMDQERVFLNIYNILTEKGDCLLSFLGYMPIVAIYNLLAQSTKWRPLLIKGIKAFNSPYHNMQDPVKKIKKMMERIGFTNIYVKCQDMHFVFEDIEHLKATIKAVEPFNMPKDVFEEFMIDFLDVAQEQEIDLIHFNYRLIIVHANK